METVKSKIIKALAGAGHPLASHEFPFIGTNENCIATRLSELAREGRVASRFRQGKRFKEWFIQQGQGGLF